MRNPPLLALCGAFVFACGLSSAAPAADDAPDTLVLYAPDQPDTLKTAGGGAKATVEKTPEGLRIHLDAGKGYPGVFIKPPAPWNLEPYAYVRARVRNVGKHAARIHLRVDNPASAGQNPWNTGTRTIRAGTTEIVQTRMGQIDGRGYPLDKTNVFQLLVFASDPAEDVDLLVEAIEAGGNPNPPADTAFPDAEGRLVRFDAHFDAVALPASNASARRVDGALEVVPHANRDWPGVTLSAPGGVWDLSPFRALSFDLMNVGDRDFDVYVRIDSQPADGGKPLSYTERVATQPGQRTTMTVRLRRQANKAIQLTGMLGQPDGLYASDFDPARTARITLFTNKAPVDQPFRVSAVRALGQYTAPAWATMTAEQFFPFIDEYGQFIHKDWPGKIHDDADLQKYREAEDADLAARPRVPGWNAYGGFADGPRLEATGHFRTAKHEGKWYLVDPEGALFFSVGANCVEDRYNLTSLVGRDGWFRNLPEAGEGAFGKFRVKDGKVGRNNPRRGQPDERYAFSHANLLRKYGPDWAATYIDRVHRRFASWGVNTIGNWSAQSIWSKKKTPYTLTFWHNAPGLKDGQVPFPDPFHPDFPQKLRGGLNATWVAGSHDDPYCIGYFVDNEMPWGGAATLALYALDSSAKQPAKRALFDFLVERHGDLAALNAAWGTTYADVDAFLAAKGTRPATDAAQADLEAFTGLAAERYFQSVRDAIRDAAPHKLYLGCRSVGGAANVAAMAAKYCDVVSYNVYSASVRELSMPGDPDVPMMIGEFHFGALDRGPFWGGLFAVADQAERAEKFKDYVRSALDNPRMVGVHWFQYGDEAATGRPLDAENGQMGMVDVADTPYPELVEAMREVAAELYPRRLKK